MMTQTHTLIAASLFARRGLSVKHYAAIIAGSLAPDAAIYGLFLWSKLAGIAEQRLWDEIYFQQPMLTLTAIGNSFPLYITVLLVGIWFAQRADASPAGATAEASHSIIRASHSAIGLFALAAMTHLAGDLPVHVSDAHPHFWPLTDWRFVSPVSYWDPNHNGGIFSMIEAALGVALSVVIFRRFKNYWVRSLTILAMAAYVAVPVYFSLILGHH